MYEQLMPSLQVLASFYGILSRMEVADESLEVTTGNLADISAFIRRVQNQKDSQTASFKEVLGHVIYLYQSLCLKTVRVARENDHPFICKNLIVDYL